MWEALRFLIFLIGYTVLPWNTSLRHAGYLGLQTSYKVKKKNSFRRKVKSPTQMEMKVRVSKDDSLVCFLRKLKIFFPEAIWWALYPMTCVYLLSYFSWWDKIHCSGSVHTWSGPSVLASACGGDEARQAKEYTGNLEGEEVLVSYSAGPRKPRANPYLLFNFNY